MAVNVLWKLPRHDGGATERPDDAEDEAWDAQVRDLSAEVTRWIGNDTRPLQFTATELTKHARTEPVLHDVLREGLTIAGTQAWLTNQLPTRRG